MGQHSGNLTRRESAANGCFDDKIVRLRVGESEVLVGVDSLIELDELRSQATNRTRGQLPKVTKSEPSVLPTDLDEARERQIVANEDSGSSHEASRERLVVAVSQSHHPAVSVVERGIEWCDFQDPKVAVSAMADGVTFAQQVEPRVGELVGDFLDEVAVREREPGVSGPGCLDAEERITLDDLSSAVEEHRVSGGWSPLGAS